MFFLTLGGLWVWSQVGWLTKRARACLKSNEPARRVFGRVLAITRGLRLAICNANIGKFSSIAAYNFFRTF
jgi:hypothetical protein